MNAKILSIVAASGVLIGSVALVQAQQTGAPGQRMQRGESSRPGGATPSHEVQQRGVRGQRGVSGFAPGQAAGVDDRDNKTTGFGGHADDPFVRDRDDRSPGDREGHLRGDRGAGMMDNVRRDDEELTDR